MNRTGFGLAPRLRRTANSELPCFQVVPMMGRADPILHAWAPGAFEAGLESKNEGTGTEVPVPWLDEGTVTARFL